jgi:hypothetical protein
MNPAILAAIAASANKGVDGKPVAAAKSEMTETVLYGCILAMIVVGSFIASGIALIIALR